MCTILVSCRRTRSCQRVWFSVGSASRLFGSGHNDLARGREGKLSAKTRIVSVELNRKHLAIVFMMENQAFCSVYTGCGGSGTYESTLADQNVLAMTWGTINHNSEPNYIALLGAVDDGSTSGDGVCCYFETTPNLVDKIENAGLT